MLTAMDKPLVSVGIPTHNRLSKLKVALECVFSQTEQNLDIIISDNCSNDGTEEYCRGLSIKDNRVRYYRQAENIGALANLNFVLTTAVGEYFFWLADDDLIDHEFVARLLPAFFTFVGQPPVLVACDVNYVDMTNNLNNKVIKLNEFRPENRWPDVQPKLFVSAKSPALYQIIYGIHKTAILKKAMNEVKPTFHEQVLIAAVAAKGRVIALPLNLRTFIVHDNNIFKVLSIGKNRIDFFISKMYLKFALLSVAFRCIPGWKCKMRIVGVALVDWAKSMPFEIYALLYIDKVRKFLGIYSKD